MSAPAFLASPDPFATQVAEAIFDRSALSWLASETSSPEFQAATRLGALFSSEFHDSWLTDAARERSGNGDQARRLAAAAAYNNQGDPDGAIRELAVADSRSALGIRMQLERTYALHRALRSEDCYQSAKSAMQAIAGRPYPWLRAQLSIEFGVCATISGREGEGLVALRLAEQDLAGSSFAGLRMRAVGIRSNLQTNAGDPWAAAPAAAVVMSQYWDGPYPANRAHQVLINESHACDQLAWPYASALLMRAPVEAIAETQNRSTEAIGLNHLAALDLEVGWNDDAIRASRRAKALFDELPASKTRALYLADAEVALAAGRLGSGDPTAAAAALEESVHQFPELPTFLLNLRRSALLGKAYSATGRPELAEIHLQRAVDKVWDRLHSLTRKSERAVALEEAAPIFRNIAALQVAGKRPEDAFLVWRAFLEGERKGDTYLPRQGRGLVYLAWGDSYFGWLTTPQGSRLFPIQASSRQIDRSVSRVLGLASRPDSNLGELHKEAQWLYLQLVGPVSTEINRGEPLRIAPDGALSALPFAILETPEGQFLGNRNPLVVGILADVLAPPLPAVHSGLVIGAPASGAALAARFPYLPESAAEADSVARQIPGAIALTGPAATLERLSAWQQMPGVFHFAGHGYSNAGHGALVMATPPGSSEPSLLTSERIAQLNFEQCRLAVLSGCMTATGIQRGPSNPSSLVRAFLVAGVPEVVASHWSVDSAATRKLMEYFYGDLARGAATPRALSSAMQKLQRDPAYAHPYYWAAFEVFR